MFFSVHIPDLDNCIRNATVSGESFNIAGWKPQAPADEDIGGTCRPGGQRYIKEAQRYIKEDKRYTKEDKRYTKLFIAETPCILL